MFHKALALRVKHEVLIGWRGNAMSEDDTAGTGQFVSLGNAS